MTADVTASEPFAAVGPLLGLSRRRVSIGFLNWAHALDHFVMLVYPTVVIELQAVYGRSYSELIGLSTASFIAFGLFSLPAGLLADRWSRRNMMVAFYLGCGASLIGAALAPSLVGLAIALFVLGIFAAIYHPVGTAMVIESATHRGRTMAFNGVCGNLGISLAAGITAILTAALSWRGAFFVPGIVCIATGIAYVWVIPDEEQHKSARSSTADVPLSAAVAAIIFGLFIVVALAAGLVFNTLSVALPKIVDERVSGISLVEIGGLTTAVFICGAIAQMAVGRLVERFRLHILFAVLAVMQFSGVVWTAYASGVMVLFALAFTMASICGQNRALYRRCLARPRLCRALLPHLHDFGHRRVDDRVLVWPRRLSARAWHHSLCGARLSDRGGGHRLYRRQRGTRPRSACHAGGVSGAGQVVRPALFSSSQTERIRRASASAFTWIADCATPAPWRSARRRRTAY